MDSVTSDLRPPVHIGAHIRPASFTPAGLREYRFTFGQKYALEVHPRFGAAHPDGWLTILAHDDLDARVAAVNLLGQEWAFMYPPRELETVAWGHLFPRGELGRLTSAEASALARFDAVALAAIVREQREARDGELSEQGWTARHPRTAELLALVDQEAER